MVNKGKNITVLGGNGFVGGHLCAQLSEAGHHITVLSRTGMQSGLIALIPNTRVITTNVYDLKNLQKLFESQDVVINLVGILNERGFSGKGFQRAHTSLTETVLKAMQPSSCRRYLHMSALGAGQGESHYLVSKGEAETEVTKASDQGIQSTIFQPSVIFGRNDSFINRFAQLLKLAPVLPLACAKSQFQPVWVGDVAAAFVQAVDNIDLSGQSLQLGGPTTYTLKSLVDYVADTLGLKRVVIGLPNGLSWLQGQIMDFVPGKPFSSDNYRSLQLDSVCTDNVLPQIGIQPHSLEEIVPSYLLAGAKRQRYQSYQAKARRD